MDFRHVLTYGLLLVSCCVLLDSMAIMKDDKKVNVSISIMRDEKNDSMVAKKDEEKKVNESMMAKKDEQKVNDSTAIMKDEKKVNGSRFKDVDKFLGAVNVEAYKELMNHVQNVEVQICKEQCDRAQAYASIVCTTVFSFGSTTVCAFYAIARGNPFLCGLIEGVGMGIATMCGSEYLEGVCQFCGNGYTLEDLLKGQAILRKTMRYYRESYRNLTAEFGNINHHIRSMEAEILAEMRFGDLFRNFNFLQQLFDKLSLDDFMNPRYDMHFHVFNYTLFSPGKTGIFALVLDFHHMMASGGHSLAFLNPSVFSFETDYYCSLDMMGQLEEKQMKVLYFFFFALKFSGLKSEGTRFKAMMTAMRDAQRKHIEVACKGFFETLNKNFEASMEKRINGSTTFKSIINDEIKKLEEKFQGKKLVEFDGVTENLTNTSESPGKTPSMMMKAMASNVTLSNIDDAVSKKSEMNSPRKEINETDDNAMSSGDASLGVMVGSPSTTETPMFLSSTEPSDDIGVNSTENMKGLELGKMFTAMNESAHEPIQNGSKKTNGTVTEDGKIGENFEKNVSAISESSDQTLSKLMKAIVTKTTLKNLNGTISSQDSELIATTTTDDKSSGGGGAGLGNSDVNLTTTEKVPTHTTEVNMTRNETTTQKLPIIMLALMNETATVSSPNENSDMSVTTDVPNVLSIEESTHDPNLTTKDLNSTSDILVSNSSSKRNDMKMLDLNDTKIEGNETVHVETKNVLNVTSVNQTTDNDVSGKLNNVTLLNITDVSPTLGSIQKDQCPTGDWAKFIRNFMRMKCIF